MEVLEATFYFVVTLIAIWAFAYAYLFTRLVWLIKVKGCVPSVARGHIYIYEKPPVWYLYLLVRVKFGRRLVRDAVYIDLYLKRFTHKYFGRSSKYVKQE